MINVDYIFLCSTYNRKVNLKRSIVPLCDTILEKGYSAKIVVVDNNSIDGTLDSLRALQNAYSFLDVILTEKDSFWAESMRLGFEKVSNLYSYRYLVPFNDDILLDVEQCSLIFTQFDFAVVHCFKDEKGKHSYGGYITKYPTTRLFQLPVYVEDGFQNVDTCNMNLVVIPYEYICKVGFLDDWFVHRGADTAWGYKVNSAGMLLKIPNFYLGICDRNSDEGTFKDKNISRINRLKIFNSKKFYPISFWYRYCRDFGGVFWPFFFILSYIKVLY